MGAKVAFFGIGLGPTLLEHTSRSGTTWRLSALPVGGYVALSAGDPKAGFRGTGPLLRRLVIILAGPAANVLLAIAIFAASLGILGDTAFLPVATRIVPGSAAQQAGFQPGDRITAAAGRPVHLFEDLRPALQANPDKRVIFTIDRKGQLLGLTARLGARQDGARTIGVLGIFSTATTHVRVSPGTAIAKAAGLTWRAIEDAARGFAGIVASGRGAANVAGVVGVARLTGEAASHGVAPLLTLAAILSANLALMNLLPIPVLDGGALIFCLAELLLRRPIPDALQAGATRAGLAALGAIFLLTTAHDIAGLGAPHWLRHF